jgi:hypothetical protein
MQLDINVNVKPWAYFALSKLFNKFSAFDVLNKTIMSAKFKRYTAIIIMGVDFFLFRKKIKAVILKARDKTYNAMRSKRFRKTKGLLVSKGKKLANFILLKNEFNTS